MVLRKLSQTFRVALALMVATFSSGLLAPATSVNALSTSPNNSCLPGTILLEKFEWDSDNEIYVLDDSSDGNTVSVAGDATSGTFSVTSGYTVSDVFIKGSTITDQDHYDPAVTSGSFSNSGLTEVKTKGNGETHTVTHDISNLQFCGTATPPHDECPLLSGNQPAGTSCTAPADEKEVQSLAGVVDCDLDTFTIQNQERTRSFTWDGDSWEPGTWSEWTNTTQTVTPATDEQCPPHDECPNLSGNQPAGTSCTAPANERETRSLDGVVNCLDDTYTIVHQERTRSFTWDGDSWEAGAWSGWTTYDTTVTAATNEQCPPQDEDICPNVAGPQFIIPAGLVKDDNGNCVTDQCPLVPGVQTDTTLCPPGQGGGTPTTPTTPGQTLGTSTTTTPQVLSTSTELPSTLPATGGSSNPLMIVLASAIAYGAAYFLQGRRQLAREQV